MIYNPAWARAIGQIESSNNYGAVTDSGKGRRALGRYQVMDFNVAPWTQEVLGRSMTPDEFLSDQGAQDAVFEKKFGGFADKYGSPQEAASVWFTGRPMAQGANARDILGTTGSGYVSKFNKALGQTDGVSAINTAMGGSNQGDGSMMPFAPTSLAPSKPAEAQGFMAGGPGAWFGMPNGVTSGGYDVADAMMGAGAGLQSIDNAKGAAVIAAMQANGRKTKKADGEFTYDPKSGVFYRTRADGSLETLKNPNASPEDAPKAKLTEGALKNAGESVEKYGTIAAINKEGSDVLDDLQTGKLDLGAFKNWINSGQNMAGISDEKSRAYARYQQFLQKVSNDNLLLNKGVQTEGDAYREMKAIGAGGASYDNETAKEALRKLITRGQEAVTQRGRSTLDAHVATYGSEPFKSFLDQHDRWKADYDTINKRIEGYAKPAPAATAPASGGFKVIKAY